MAARVDRRIIRTKNSIRNALVSLIEEKGFDAVSVKDISNRAGINRGTFYLHYRDKFDLLEQTVAQTVQEMHQMILQINSLDISSYRNSDEPFPVIVLIFEYVNHHASLMRALFEIKGDFALENQIKRLIGSSVSNNDFSFFSKENAPIPPEYLISYLASAHLGVIQQWLQDGRRETPCEMALILTKLTMRGPLFAAGVMGEGGP